MTHSQFDNRELCLDLRGGTVQLENNLFAVRYELGDAVQTGNTATGSYFRFNTVVNTSGVASDGRALSCGGALDVTSNIFAYGSKHPTATSDGTPCPTSHSLFDTVALAPYPEGGGNRVGDGATFFVDRAGGDFHLAPSSPAIDGAETGLPTTTDFDGRPRSSTPDMGAFEAP